MKVLLIDNYDSFTFNLAQYIGEVDQEPQVERNDEITLGEIHENPPEAIVISPGPGTPSDAGISLDVIEEFGDEIPILGVCLGHQCIAQSQGAELKRADRLLHGKTADIFHSDFQLYEGLSNPLKATRYHSLLVDETTVPEALSVDALSEENEIMGLHHTDQPMIGVQYHPESILTEHGRRLIRN
ncbi:MAG: aminodeoxychorismate/anthranilate synthase component II, partial [bacterium]